MNGESLKALIWTEAPPKYCPPVMPSILVGKNTYLNHMNTVVSNIMMVLPPYRMDLTWQSSSWEKDMRYVYTYRIADNTSVSIINLASQSPEHISEFFIWQHTDCEHMRIPQ